MATRRNVATMEERVLGVITLELTTLLVWLIGVFLAYLFSDSLTALAAQLAAVETPPSAGELLLAFVLAIVVLTCLHRAKWFATAISVLLGYMIFGGAALFVGGSLAFFIAVGFILYQRLSHTFLSNNLLVCAAVLFGAFPIALGFPIELILFLLVVFSVYDVIGVFLTNFIPNLARRAVESQLPLLLLAPRATVRWNEDPEKGIASMLGAGDVFLPMIFLSSVTLVNGPFVALAVLLGALAGWMGNNLLSIVVRGGIPAMPLLTAGMMVAYFIAK